MLTTKRKITITGTSTIDGEIAENYRAEIEEENPENMVISPSFTPNKTLRTENRATCRADKREFEDLVYALQDEMIAANETEEETTDGDY